MPNGGYYRMVNMKAVFAWIFPFKFECTRSQAMVHTYFRLFKIMMYNFLCFPLKLSQQLLYHLYVGIIGICLVLSDFLNMQ